MNALELADKLKSSLTMEYECDKYMEQAATMLRQLQEKITKYELRHTEQRKRIEQLEHMMEKASHYEAMAHAGGFEAGYQAAQANFNKENPVKEVFNKKEQEK